MDTSFARSQRCTQQRHQRHHYLGLIRDYRAETRSMGLTLGYMEGNLWKGFYGSSKVYGSWSTSSQRAGKVGDQEWTDSALHAG